LLQRFSKVKKEILVIPHLPLVLLDFTVFAALFVQTHAAQLLIVLTRLPGYPRDIGVKTTDVQMNAIVQLIVAVYISVMPAAVENATQVKPTSVTAMQYVRSTLMHPVFKVIVPSCVPVKLVMAVMEQQYVKISMNVPQISTNINMNVTLMLHVQDIHQQDLTHVPVTQGFMEMAKQQDQEERDVQHVILVTAALSIAATQQLLQGLLHVVKPVVV